jgi:hypothetical protein
VLRSPACGAATSLPPLAVLAHHSRSQPDRQAGHPATPLHPKPRCLENPAKFQLVDLCTDWVPPPEPSPLQELLHARRRPPPPAAASLPPPPCRRRPRLPRLAAPVWAMIASIKKTTFHSEVYEPAEVRPGAPPAWSLLLLLLARPAQGLGHPTPPAPIGCPPAGQLCPCGCSGGPPGGLEAAPAPPVSAQLLPRPSHMCVHAPVCPMAGCLSITLLSPLLPAPLPTPAS